MGYVGVESSLLIALKSASGELWDGSEMKQVCLKVTSQYSKATWCLLGDSNAVPTLHCKDRLKLP
jgi:hypothetical protein